MKKKLIEVALPLEKINEESAREKSIRHGHPSTLHLWWARRPLAAARAVIWASLVDDPSSHPEEFPTEEEQNRERQRLFRILEELVVWENSNNQRVLDDAKREIMKSTGGDPPELLDPFAGGGAIPLEAQRLGLVAHAHDLNPVAVMINKAMIEIPPKFAGRPPVNPEYQNSLSLQRWSGAQGLAEDVRYYGEWMKQKAWERIGHLYPKVKDEHGKEHTVIAWIWARTVKCPNPACRCEMPLMKSLDLSTKKNNEAHIQLNISGREITYSVENGRSTTEGTIARSGATCPVCGASVDFPYIRNEGKNGRMIGKMVAVVAEGNRGRVYLTPDSFQTEAAIVEKPKGYPSGVLSGKCRVNVSLYGFDETSDLFTNRQLTALTTFSDLVAEAQQQAQADAIAAGLPDDGAPLCEGGTGARAYGEAVGVYLAFTVSREANRLSSLCVWNRVGEKIEQTFSRQAIPMIWDFAEANIFSNSTGSWPGQLEWIPECIRLFPATNQENALQADAQNDSKLSNMMISTDPPCSRTTTGRCWTKSSPPWSTPSPCGATSWSSPWGWNTASGRWRPSESSPTRPTSCC